MQDYLHQWVSASKLTKGEHLKTPDGALAVADGGTTPKDHNGWMWDLTVPGNNDHDFYIIAGTADILVHNTACVVLPSNSGKDTIAVIGNLKDTAAATSRNGHEVLDLSDWSEPQNDKWIEEIIQKKQTVYLASEINDAMLGNGKLKGSAYARELNQLLKAGYTFTENGQYMVPGK